MNILLTSAGRRVSLIRFFQKTVKALALESKVIVAELKPELSSAAYEADEFYTLPRVTAPEYIDNLLKLCINENIKLIIPTIDTELLVLAQNRAFFHNKGIEVLISDEWFIKACRDKRKIHQFFEKNGVAYANEMDKSKLSFPLFAKPYDGSCSVDTYFVENEQALNDKILSNDKLMFLEYIDHDLHSEFTIDLYFDRNSELKCIVPRERIEVRGGEVSKGITRKNNIVDYISKKMSKVEGLRGCITLQVFRHNVSGDIIGIEVNPRFGGGYPLSYLAGADFPMWIIQEYLLNKEVENYDKWEENLLLLRYDDEILVHDASV